jgi:long-chain acyl-CoA synthetase
MTSRPPELQTLKTVLEASAARFGDRTAIVMGEERLTFARLDEHASRVANALVKLGVQPGDRVATVQGSNPAFAAAFFGIMKAGAVAVPLDPRYVGDELVSLFSDCTPKVLIAESDCLESVIEDVDRFGLEHIITFGDRFHGRFHSFEDILANESTAAPDVSINPDDVCIISYTGGPTLTPHGVALCHLAVCWEARDSADTFRQTQDDVMVQFALPTYHQFGLTAVLLASVLRGNRLVIVPGTGRSIHNFMEAVEREKGTMYMGVPYIYSLLINVARREGIKHDLSSLRLCVSGGAPLEPPVVQLFEEHYGLCITEIYGLTESVCHVTMMPLDGSGPAGSAGLPLPCWELKIFDENDNEVPAGTEGEICVRGPFMTGFYGHPDASSAALRGGWLHTGDLGKVDARGFLSITARKRRMIILKGQNVFPSDIEAVIATHPAVDGVKVRGEADLVRGETILALVKLNPGASVTAQELRQYCQGKMADYKLPRDVAFVETLPATVPVWRRPREHRAADINL